MDPNSALMDALTSLFDEDRAAAAANLIDLADWISRGGLYPETISVAEDFVFLARGKGES